MTQPTTPPTQQAWDLRVARMKVRKYEDTLREIAGFRAGAWDYDDDVGHPRRDFDDTEAWDMVEQAAQRVLDTCENEVKYWQEQGWAPTPAAPVELTTEDRDILVHALGGDYPHKIKGRRAYRYHYCANVDDKRLPALVDRGLMRAGPVINDATDRYYYVTEAGAAAVDMELP